MKKIEAIIHQYQLVGVKNALQGRGVERITVMEVHEIGGHSHTMTYRGVTRTIDSAPRVRIEAIVQDHKLEVAIDAILQHARTGAAGDGTITVSDVDRVIRIRTGETEASDTEITGNQVTPVVAPGDQSRWDVPSYQHSW